MKLSRYTCDSPFSYTLGPNVTLDLLRYLPQSAQRVYISSALVQSEATDRVLSLAASHKIPVEVSDKAFNILSPKSNCFVIGQFQKFSQPLDPKAPHIVLVNPSDAGNIGAIIRTAVGFGLGHIAIITPAADIFAPKAVRGSMGALFSTHFELFDSMDAYRQKFTDHTLYAFMLKGATLLKKASLKAPYSLVFGNEASGLPDDYASFCTPLRIPHSELIDSLSLPIAASIAMYAVTEKCGMKVDKFF